MKTLTLIFAILTLAINTFGQTDVKKVHYLDKEYVDSYIEAYYIGCQELVSDTVYKLKYNLQSQGEWKVYYDTDLNQIQSHYFTRNDTTFAVLYYRNGQKKAEDQTLPGYEWVYSAEWCDNGQLIFSRFPNYTQYFTATSYYCNGQKQWEGNLYHGNSYGLETRWYQNGQRQSEKRYTEFDQKLAESGLLESHLISEKYWDENGNEIEAFSNDLVAINTFGAPIIINEKELENKTAYYQITGQEEYDATMSVFQEEVYKRAKLSTNCDCKVGLVYISFTVKENGSIEDIKLDQGLEDCVDNVFLEAIREIGNWPPGKIAGIKVDTRVRVALQFEKIRK